MTKRNKIKKWNSSRSKLKAESGRKREEEKSMKYWKRIKSRMLDCRSIWSQRFHIGKFCINLHNCQSVSFSTVSVWEISESALHFINNRQKGKRKLLAIHKMSSHSISNSLHWRRASLWWEEEKKN